MQLAAGFAGHLHAEAPAFRQLLPLDQAGQDEQLVALLDHMRIMVQQQDARALESLMLPTFRVEFDVGKGPQSFRKYWRPESATSPIWGILHRLLSIGGTFYTDSLFAIPYVYTRFPFDLDPFANVVALGSNVGVFDQPADTAERIASLDYSIVPLAKPLDLPVRLPADGYFEVKLPDVEHSFVAASDVYSPAAHRIFFENRAGKWYWLGLASATLATPPDLTRLKRRN